MRRVTSSSALALAGVTVVWSGCSPGGAQVRTGGQTSEAVPVDSLEDNAAVLDTLVEGLFVVLRIQNGLVTMESAEVRSFPRPDVRDFGEGMIRVVATADDGSEVSSVVVPDGELNAQEGGGLVRVTDRTVPLMIPLTRSVSGIQVQMGPEGSVQSLDVSGVIGSYCEERPQQALCRS